MGLGSQQASALSALIVFFVRDWTGMAAGIAFTYVQVDTHSIPSFCVLGRCAMLRAGSILACVHTVGREFRLVLFQL